MSTLHFKDSELEIHKVVVGPMDNNVFVLRCKQTGESLLIDAANEHKLLLDLCKQLNVQSVIETHGHWYHIQAVPQVRNAGYSVHVTQADAHMLRQRAQISPESDFLSDCGRDTAACAGLRPMRAARSAKSGMRTALARP